MDGASAGWFELSYIGLWAWVLLLSILLKKMLLDVVPVKLRLQKRGDHKTADSALSVPFEAPFLLGEGRIRSRDLLGREVMLLFVRPEDRADQLDKQLRTSAYGLMHKAHGHLYVICSGNRVECGLLVSELANADGSHFITVLLDDQGEISRMFQVDRTPMAIHLDSNGQIKAIGRQRTVSTNRT